MTATAAERAAEMVKALRDLRPGQDLTVWAALELALTASFELREEVTELQQKLSKGAAAREEEALDEASLLERRAMAVARYRKYTEQLMSHYGVDRPYVDAVMAELRAA